MREIPEGARGAADGMCRLWGAKVKGADQAAPDQPGRGTRRPGARPDVPTRGRRIGAGTFVAPAYSNRYAPVVAAFPPKATAMPTGARAGLAGYPGAALPADGGANGRNFLPKTSRPGGCGCGCGGGSKENGRG